MSDQYTKQAKQNVARHNSLKIPYVKFKKELLECEGNNIQPFIALQESLERQNEIVANVLIDNIRATQNLKQKCIILAQEIMEGNNKSSSREEDINKLQIEMNDLKEAIRILANSLTLTDP